MQIFLIFFPLFYVVGALARDVKNLTKEKSKKYLCQIQLLGYVTCLYIESLLQLLLLLLLLLLFNFYS